MSHKTLFAALLLAALAAFSPMRACAQGVDDARIDRLLEVMRARQTVDAMLPQVELSQRQMAAQLTAGQALDDAQQARLDAIIARSSDSVRKALAWDKLLPLYRNIYRDTFSAEDVDAMIAFYESDAGQRLLDKMPLLMQNTMTAVQTLVVPMLQQMEQDIRAETSAGG